MIKIALSMCGAALLATTASVSVAGAASATEQVSQASDITTVSFDSAGTFPWTVPYAVTSITVDLYGAQGADGGDPNYGREGGKGGHTRATLAVTPAQKFQIHVGGKGDKATGGYNGGGHIPSPKVGNHIPRGGGGGGASDIRTGGDALKDRKLIAGGGGGAGRDNDWGKVINHGGAGGGEAGGDGKASDESGWTPIPEVLGRGGTSSAGGTGYCGTDGSLGQGGNESGYTFAGAGGGGYYGGSAGCGTFGIGGYGGGAGGGGGSGYAAPNATDVLLESGVQSGNGKVSISYSDPHLDGVQFLSPGTTEWTVPAGVHSITAELDGAQGGDGEKADGTVSPGGKGGHTTATIPVTPGQKLQINVGGQGGSGGYLVGGRGGHNGGAHSWTWAGGGGGASDIRTNGYAHDNRQLVAGGGGGAGNHTYRADGTYSNEGGAGGGLSGGTGGGTNLKLCLPKSTFGGGGTPTAGGTGGRECGLGTTRDGSKGEGGNGDSYSGGGGGGWNGGGGGAYDSYYYIGAGGGGGSSHVSDTATKISLEQGTHTGNGQITITYTTP